MHSYFLCPRPRMGPSLITTNMDMSSVAHEELLHHLEGTRETTLHAEVEHLGHSATILSDEDDDERQGRGGTVARGNTTNSSEKTPLLMAGKHVVSVDSNVDLKAMAMKLNSEEHAAVIADASLPAMEILKSEAWQLLRMSLPLILAVMLEFMPDMVLTMMVGHTDEEHSTQILAAFSLSGLCQMIFIATLTMGLSAATDTMCSQAFGGKRYTQMWMFSQAALLMYVAMFPFIAIALLNGPALLKMFGQDPAIADIAGNCIVMYVLAQPFLIVFTVIKSALQAQNIVAPFVVVSVVACGISLPTAYFLGMHTSMGYVGVAFSVVIYNAVKAIGMVPVLVRNQVFIESWPGWQLREAAHLVPKITHLGVSSVLMVFFQMAGIGIISLLAGLLPNAAVMISANSIFGTMMALSFLPLMGLCIAGAIRIGNALGAGQARRASLIGRLVIIASMCVATLVMVGIALIAPTYTRAFTSDEATLSVALSMLYKLVGIIPVIGLLFGLQSIFRGCGKQWLCAKLNFACLFVVGVPVGFYIAVSLDVGIVGLWYGHFVGMTLFVAYGWFWLSSLNWRTMAHEARLNTHLHVEVPRTDVV